MAPVSSPYDFEAPSYEKAMTGIRSRLPKMMDKEYGVTSRAQTKLVPTMLKLLSGMDIVWENKNHGVVEVNFVMELVQKSTKNVSQRWRLRIVSPVRLLQPLRVAQSLGCHGTVVILRLPIPNEVETHPDSDVAWASILFGRGDTCRFTRHG